MYVRMYISTGGQGSGPPGPAHDSAWALRGPRGPHFRPARPGPRLRMGAPGPQDAPESCQTRTESLPRPPQKPHRRRLVTPSCSRCPHHSPRGRLDGPPELLEASQESPKRPKSSIFICFFDVLCLVAFSAFRRSKTAPDAPKTAPRRPQGAGRELHVGPTRPQDGPRAAQEGSKWLQEGPKEAQEREYELTNRDLRPKRPPGGSKRPPRGPQKTPKKPCGGPKRLPKKAPRGKHR